MNKIKDWSVEIEGFGGYLERDADNIAEMLKEMSPDDDPYIIECRGIEEEEYEKLPEFTGWRGGRLMDIKKLRELREKAASGRYGKHKNCLAVEADMIQPIVTAYHRKNLNRAMADIEYIVEACNALPDALDEIERLEKALKSACNELVEFAGSCPPDIHLRSWGGCLGENCKNEYAECWKEYFLNRSVSP